MYKSKLIQEMRDSVSSDKKIQARITKYMSTLYLKPPIGEIYRVALREWLDRVEPKRPGRPKKVKA